MLHIFDVSLLAGEQGSRIEQKYIAPVITAPQIEIIPLFPGNAAEERILKLIAASFHLSGDEFGYEMKLMMIYIHEHYGEKISIPELAAAAYLSERECYRVFHDCGLGSSSYFGKVFREYAHCSPTEYRRKWQNSDR